jgi:hypothetical protein
MENQVAGWGVELTFFRAKVGREFEVISRLEGRAAPNNSPCFFGTYGYFDLTAIRTFESLSLQNLAPIDVDILESAPFRFFSDSDNSTKDQFVADIRSWRTAIAVFLKINPDEFQQHPCQARWHTAGVLREEFPAAHVFFGLGFSEILVLTGGDDLPHLLAMVSKLRDPAEGGIAEEQQPQPRTERPPFVKTTTFPLVSYSQIHVTKDYTPLTGRIHPVLTIACDAAAEPAIFRALPDGVKVRNVYGETDLIVYWASADGIPFAEFAGVLTNLRSAWAGNDLIVKTTSYLETKREPVQSEPTKPNPPVPTAEYCETSFLNNLDKLQPLALRASVTDLVLRLLSCLSDRNIEPDHRDMVATFTYLGDLVHIVLTSNDRIQVMKGKATLTQVADLARTAINQRYAGLETHPETLAHAQSPLLCDIRSIVLAASTLPRFVFENLYKDSREDLWAGYILFGTTYSPQWCPQNILALPASSIYDPVEEWWKITHEIAHAVYDLLFSKGGLEDNLYAYVEQIYEGSQISTERVINELFANWFDWKYIFQKETAFFLKYIWTSWLTFPFVWEQQKQYLVRSFAIYACGNYSNLSTAAQAGRREDHLLPHLRQEWKGFVETLQNTTEGRNFLAGLNQEFLDDAIYQVAALAPLLQFFEERFESVFSLEGLEGRLAPPYPSLAAHLERLARGEVITEEIINPCRLQLEMLKRASDAELPLATEIAYVLSLENTYVQKINSKLA